MMKKILPLIHAPIETYQGTSFILSILLAYENMSDAYFNNYVNLQCNNTDNSYKMKLEFADVAWEDYRVSGIAEMNLYYLKNIHRDNFIDFIKERIDQGNYLIFYSIDEYYLSYSEHYKNDHFSHDTYVYGYEIDCFCVMAYKERKLSRFNIPMMELLMALYCHESALDDLSFCTFRPNHAVKEIFSLEKIKLSLSDYYHSEHTGNKNTSLVYGINTYDILLSCVRKAILNFGTELAYIDLCPFRLFWEHKKVLKDHITKINESIILDDMINGMINDIESKAMIIFKLMIKYSLNNDGHILESVVSYLLQLREKEEKLIYMLLIALGN